MKLLELRIPPVAVVLACGGVMWLLARQVPAYAFGFPGQRLAAAAVFLAALAIGVRGVAVFRRHETTVNPTTPDAASAMVMTDIYALTRNPMYLGLALVLVAWALFLGSYAALLGIPLFVLYMNAFQIKPEERALGEKFGAAYDDYRRRVRRWL